MYCLIIKHLKCFNIKIEKCFNSTTKTKVFVFTSHQCFFVFNLYWIILHYQNLNGFFGMLLFDTFLLWQFIFVSFFLSFCLSVFLSFSLFLFLSFSLSLFLSLSLSLFLSFSLYLFLYFSISLFLSFSISL